MSIQPPFAREALDRLDLANPGVWLKWLLAGNGLLVGVAFFAAATPEAVPELVLAHAAWVEPTLLATLVALAPLSSRLAAWPWPAFLALSALVIAAFATGFLLLTWGDAGMSFAFGKRILAAVLAGCALLEGLELFRRARRPALAEARLAALAARIRPHFLFNSLNAALGVLRQDPRRAEAVLEALADLFRAALRAPDTFVPLSSEIDLARRYLEIEHLRLGDRLRVVWRIQECPSDLLVPPFLLQPLVENAVYHGVEPLPAGGEIAIGIAADRDGVRIEITNPHAPDAPVRAGNREALANLRNRLMLFYDLAARLETEAREDRFVVRLFLPCQR